jgi:hypothetical protein
MASIPVLMFLVASSGTLLLESNHGHACGANARLVFKNADELRFISGQSAIVHLRLPRRNGRLAHRGESVDGRNRVEMPL